MALASGKSLGKFFSAYTKGMLVDCPLAAAEGFHALPRLWGDEVPDYGTVTNVQSGFLVAGKSFALGIGHGFRDLARQRDDAGDPRVHALLIALMLARNAGSVGIRVEASSLSTALSAFLPADQADRVTADVLAWWGPAIGPCCYPVGEDVVEALRSTEAGPEPDGWVRRGPDGARVDLREALNRQARRRRSAWHGRCSVR